MVVLQVVLVVKDAVKIQFQLVVRKVVLSLLIKVEAFFYNYFYFLVLDYIGELYIHLLIDSNDYAPPHTHTYSNQVHSQEVRGFHS